MSKFFLTTFFGISLASCYTAGNDDNATTPLTPQKSIVILYDNDVHCAIDGYTKLAGLRDAIAASNAVTTTTDSIKHLMEAEANKVLGTSDFELTINDSEGNRLVRKGETNLADLCADAFRERCNADIGLITTSKTRLAAMCLTINM